MTHVAAALLALALLAWPAPPAPGQTPAAVTRTFPVTVERAWVVAESVLRSLEWEVDEADRGVGWILTESRGVDFRDYGVYGQGTRHRLRLTFRAAGEGRTTIGVEREVYREERILWMTERKPVPAADQSVETAVLDAIARAL
jgi:hypothetical protein